VHPAFICAPSVPSHLNLDCCVTTLEDWLQACNTHHTSCLAPLPRLPRRLVHVSDHDTRLVETEGLAYARYTTLSHCWGQGTHMVKTTRGNVKQHMSNINWAELNQIFKDAIAITKRIGCQWIWIDCLCIIQDDELDWKEESHSSMWRLPFPQQAPVVASPTANSTTAIKTILNQQTRPGLPRFSMMAMPQAWGFVLGSRIACATNISPVTQNSYAVKHRRCLTELGYCKSGFSPPELCISDRLK
jgi:hypothetical protein